MDSTSALVKRARAGDRQAFDEIAERFRPRLERQVQSRLGGHLRPQMDVDDVLSETFLAAFESLDRFEWRGEETFYRWLAGIAEHLIRNASRRKGWAHLRLDRDLTDARTTPRRRLRREERFDRLEDALRDLKPEYREVLVLARVDGLKVAEIAARMHRSPNAVKKLLARALTELKRTFGDTESFHLPDRRFEVEGLDDD